MGYLVDDQDFLYEGPGWPPVDRVCGGLLAHVPKIGGSYSVFYQGLARFSVIEHNKSLKGVQLELVKILNLNERIDDNVYWCFFRLEAKEKSTNKVDTYRVVVSYLADKHRDLRMFKAEEIGITPLLPVATQERIPPGTALAKEQGKKGSSGWRIQIIESAI